MAHSTAASMGANTTGEVNFFFSDENGRILTVRKPPSVNLDSIPLSSATVYPTASTATTGINANASSSSNNNTTNVTAYNQVNTLNQPQFVRLPNYKQEPMDNTIYPITTQQQQQQHNMVNTFKYEKLDTYSGAHSTSVKSEERFTNTKYTQNSNTKTKSKIHSTNSTHTSVQKKRKPEKAGKGLRHFSMKVCEKVKKKGTTTYNEVADELVTEEIQNSFDTGSCDHKNIRRRVYDALNVLMAMQIIAKDKKEIRWIGLPTSSVEQCTELEKENEKRRERIKQQLQQLRELLLQQVSFKTLIERNKEAERKGIIPTPNASIQLPFIIVNTHKSTKIHCSVTNDKSEYIFKFDDKFEMHDDIEVLKRMGLLFGLDKGECSYKDIERAKLLVPRKFEKYIEAYGNGRGVIGDSDDEMQSSMELTNDSQGFTRTDGSKTPDLDDEEEFLEHSDID